MDLVNLMYRYINRFINSDELLKELKMIDLNKYSEEEINVIKQLISSVKKIKDNIPNEQDEIEKNRLENINRMLKLIDDIKTNSKDDEKGKEFINKRYNQLLKEKEHVRDGGRLYKDLFKLLTNNSLVNKYASQMNDMELLEFITEYISVPMPPQITQKAFDDLVSVGIKEDKREALWRLAFNYNRKKMNFFRIEDYFIEKRDDYYLAELVSAVGEDLDMDKLINKIISTKDKKFIHQLIERGKHIGDMFTDEQISKIKRDEQTLWLLLSWEN